MKTRSGRNKQFDKYQNIKLQLKDHKNLDVVTNRALKVDYFHFLHAKNKDNQYFIYVESINEKENDSISQNKIQELQEKFKHQQECNHPSIIKCQSYFQIEGNFFIQMEYYDVSLEDFIKNCKSNPIHRETFVKIAIQLLEIGYYLHKKNLILKDLSLKNIFLDKQQNVKLWNIGQSYLIDQVSISKKFLSNLEDNELFYQHPKCLNLEKKQKYRVDYQDNLWSIGICLYSLAGASYMNIIDYIQYNQQYQLQYEIGFDINLAILTLFENNKSYPYLISNFRNILQDYDQVVLNIPSSSIKLKDNENNQLKTRKQIDQHKLQCNILMEKLTQGLEFQRIKQYNQALIQFQEFIDQFKDYDLPFIHLGFIYKKLWRYQDATNSFKTAITINSKNCLPYTQLGIIYGLLELYEEAIEYIVKAIEINPLCDYAYVRLGILYSDQNQSQEAIQNYNKALEINPNCHLAYYNLGEEYEQNNDLQYLEQYKKCIEIEPQFQHAYFQLGKAYYDQNNNQQAIFYLKQLLKINPVYKDANFYLAKAYSKLQLDRLAILSYKNELKSNPNDDDSLYNIGKLHFKNNRQQQAIECYTKVIEMNPKSHDAYNNLGIIYHQQGKFPEALQSYQQALKINPFHTNTYNNFGNIYIELNQLKKAECHFKKLIQLRSNESSTFIKLGNSYYLNEQDEKAMKRYKQGYKLNPNQNNLDLINQLKEQI